MQTNMDTRSETMRLHAMRFNPFIGLLAALLVFYVALAIQAYIKWGKTQGFFAVAFGVALLVFIYASLLGTWIDVSPTEITVTKFFWSKKSVARADITGWVIKRGWGPGDRLSYPYRRVEIYTRKDSKPFMVSTTPFSRKNIQRLTDILPRNDTYTRA